MQTTSFLTDKQKARSRGPFSNFFAAYYARQFEGTYFADRSFPVPVVKQVHTRPPSVELRPTVLLAILAFTPVARMVPINVTAPGAALFEPPIEIDRVYLPVVLPITAAASVGQLPCEA